MLIVRKQDFRAIFFLLKFPLIFKNTDFGDFFFTFSRILGNLLRENQNVYLLRKSNVSKAGSPDNETIPYVLNYWLTYQVQRLNYREIL